MTNEDVVKKFTDVSGDISIFLERYETMNVDKLIEEQKKVMEQMNDTLDNLNFIDTDFTLELYHICSNIVDRWAKPTD